VSGKRLAVLAALTILSCGAGFSQQSASANATAPAAVEKPPEAPKVPSSVSPDTTALPIDPKTYVIGAEDILNIRVWRENDFSGPRGVRPDGKITMPLVGDLQASGLTPARLADQIKQALSSNLKDPEVEVDVIQVNSKKYNMAGGVNRPGPYPMVTPVTVFQAINNAGGFKDFANEKDIIILRADGKTRLKFNYKDFVKHGENKKNVNVLLENGDTVLVKE
jgi:polysaccharide biosynthesis/export protein